MNLVTPDNTFLYIVSGMVSGTHLTHYIYIYI